MNAEDTRTAEPMWADVTSTAVPYADMASRLGHQLRSRQVPRRGYILIARSCTCGATGERAAKPRTVELQMADHIRWVLAG